VVPLIFLAITIPLFHTIGWLGVAVGSVIGGQTGEAINKRRAIKKVTAGGDGVTVIPLDLITGVQTRKPAGLAGRWGTRILVVTTADGAEHEFRGMTEKWQGHLARALTARGREVYTVQDAITVMPQVMGEQRLTGLTAARLQSGRLDAYLPYMIIAVIAVTAVVAVVTALA
jgi:hypothetical protein